MARTGFLVPGKRGSGGGGGGGYHPPLSGLGYPGIDTPVGRTSVLPMALAVVGQSAKSMTINNFSVTPLPIAFGSHSLTVNTAAYPGTFYVGAWITLVSNTHPTTYLNGTITAWDASIANLTFNSPTGAFSIAGGSGNINYTPNGSYAIGNTGTYNDWKLGFHAPAGFQWFATNNPSRMYCQTSSFVHDWDFRNIGLCPYLINGSIDFSQCLFEMDGTINTPGGQPFFIGGHVLSLQNCEIRNDFYTNTQITSTVGCPFTFVDHCIFTNTPNDWIDPLGVAGTTSNVSYNVVNLIGSCAIHADGHQFYPWETGTGLNIFNNVYTLIPVPAVSLKEITTNVYIPIAGTNPANGQFFPANSTNSAQGSGAREWLQTMGLNHQSGPINYHDNVIFNGGPIYCTSTNQNANWNITSIADNGAGFTRITHLTFFNGVDHVTGDTMLIHGTNCTPSINGPQKITRLSTSQFDLLQVPFPVGASCANVYQNTTPSVTPIGANTIHMLFTTGIMVGHYINGIATSGAILPLVSTVNSTAVTIVNTLTTAIAASANLNFMSMMQFCATQPIRFNNNYFSNTWSEGFFYYAPLTGSMSFENAFDANTGNPVPAFTYTDNKGVSHIGVTSINPQLTGPSDLAATPSIPAIGSTFTAANLSFTDVTGANGYQYTLNGGTTWNVLNADKSITGLTQLQSYNINVRPMNAVNDLGVPVNPGTTSTTAGLTMVPLSVAQNPWALTVWDLSDSSNTGPQGVVSYKIPQVTAYPPNVTFTPATNQVNIGQGVTMDGWDFSGFIVVVTGNNSTISNCKFDCSCPVVNTLQPLKLNAGIINLIVDHCIFDGKSINSGTWTCAISALSSSILEVRYCRFVNLPSDVLNLNSSTSLIHHNYFYSGSTLTGSHTDCIQWIEGITNAIYSNLFDLTYSPTSGQRQASAIKINQIGTNVLHNMTVNNNIISNPPTFVETVSTSQANVGANLYFVDTSLMLAGDIMVGTNISSNPVGYISSVTNSTSIVTTNGSATGLIGTVPTATSISFYRNTQYPVQSFQSGTSALTNISFSNNIVQVGYSNAWFQPAPTGIILSTGDLNLLTGSPVTEMP